MSASGSRYEVNGFHFVYKRPPYEHNYYTSFINGQCYQVSYNWRDKLWTGYFDNQGQLDRISDFDSKEKLDVFEGIVRMATGHQDGIPIPEGYAGYTGMNWYHEGKMVFEYCKGNNDTFYLGEVKGSEIRVAVDSTRRFWGGYINRKLIVGSAFSIRERTFEWLVGHWYGVE